MGEGLRVLSHLEDTTDEKIDAIARDVNVELNQGVNKLDAKSDKLVKDVKAETAEMRKIIESAEFGIPAPSLASMTAVSDEAGINVTVTATDATVDYSSNKAVLAITKGVMVRYKDGSYPTNKADGELAFIDDDLFTVDTNGNRVAKAKTHLVVGLTKDHTYYFSAFPYTQQGAHNERLGVGNVAKCKWVGNASTLTVSIAKDYDIFDLGEVTVTLRNDSTGETHTQKRTGVGNVVFGGIAAGAYTVSFAGANADCSNPDSQSVVLTAGIPTRIDAIYKAKIGTFEQTSWDMISRVSKAGIANQVFNIGDTKKITVGNQGDFTLRIAHISDVIYLITDEVLQDNINFNTPSGFDAVSGAKPTGGFPASTLYAYLLENVFYKLPDDLANVVVKRSAKYATKGYGDGAKDPEYITKALPIWIPFRGDLNVSDKDTYPDETKGNFAYYTSAQSRIKTRNGQACEYWLASIDTYYNTKMVGVITETGGSSAQGCAPYGGSGSSKRNYSSCFGLCV